MSYFSNVFDLFLFVYLIEYADADAKICNKTQYDGDSTCIEGYKKLPDIASCARLNTESKSWSDAREDCRKDGADLFVANNKATREAWNKIDLNKDNKAFYAWIGLREAVSGTGKFVWLDQTEEVEEADIPWAVGEPQARETRRCVYTHITHTETWRATRCVATLAFFCRQILGPEPRRITVDIPSSTDTGVTVRISKKFSVSCTAYHSSDAEITFLINPGDRSVYSTENITRSDPRVEIKEDRVYDWDGDHCGLKTVAVLTVMAMAKHHLGYVSCCRSKPRACEASVPIKIESSTSTQASTPATDSTKATSGGVATVPSDFKPYPKSELCKKEDFVAKFPCGSKHFIDLKHFGTCIRFFEKPLNWDTARSRCMYHHQADLVRVTTKEFDEALTDLIPNRSQNYWIGLHDRRRPGQFGWLDDNQKASWFNWKKDRPEDYKRGFACAMKTRNGGLWSHAPCLEKMFFICQKVSGRNPGKAKLDVSFTPGYDQAYVGQTMKAYCSSFTYGDGNFKFGFENNETFTPISEGDSRLSQEDRAYVLDGDRCFMKSRVLLYINVTKEMDGANVRCCWRHSAGFSSCTKSQNPVETKFLPHAPVMEVGDEVLYTDDVIVVNCSAYVGTGGQLVWRLKTHSGTREWRVGLDGTYREGETENTKNNVFNTTQSAKEAGGDVVVRGFEAEADDTYGPRILSTFSLAVTSDLQGATLACVSFNPNTKDKIVTSHVFSVLSQMIRDTTYSGMSMTALLFWALLVMAVLLGCFIFLVPVGVVRRKSPKRFTTPQPHRKRGRSERHIKPPVLQLSKKKKKEVRSRERIQSIGSSVDDEDFSTYPEGEIPDYQYASILPSVSASSYIYYEEDEFVEQEISDYTESTGEGNISSVGSVV